MPTYDYSNPDDADAEAIRQKMALAAMITQQGMSQAPVYSNKAGIAKMLTAALGGYQMQQAQGEHKALAERSSAANSAEIQQVLSTAEGGNAGKLARLLAGSKNPEYRKMGLAMALKEKDQKEEEYGTTPQPGIGPGGIPVMAVFGKRGGMKIIPGLMPPEKYHTVNGALVAEPRAPGATVTPAYEGQSPEIREFEGLLKAAGIDSKSPEGQALFKAVAEKKGTHPPSAQIKVNSYTPASETAQAEFMKSTRATYDALKQAPVALESIEKAKALIPGARGFMGPGGDGMLEAAKFMNNRLGFKIDTEGVKSAEELRTRIFFNVMDNLKKMDAQPSEMQQKLMMDALGKLGTDPNALPAVLDAFAEAIRGKVALHNREADGAAKRGVKFPFDPIIPIGGTALEDALKQYGPR